MTEATPFDILMIASFLAVWIGALTKGEWFVQQSLAFRLTVALSYAALFGGWIVSKHV